MVLQWTKKGSELQTNIDCVSIFLLFLLFSIPQSEFYGVALEVSYFYQMKRGPLATVTLGSDTYHVSAAKDDPIVLVDEDGLALLSLAVAGAFITLRPDGGFQGVFHGEGTFGFTLKSHATFKLNFGLFRGSKPVNEISVIRPDETLSIDCDQTGDSKQFIIEPLEITVEEDEKKGVDKASGTYFDVRVFPEKGYDLRKARWTCPDVVVTKQTEWPVEPWGPKPNSFRKPDFMFRRGHKARNNNAPSFEPAFAVVDSVFSFGGNSAQPVPCFSSGGGNDFSFEKDTLASRVTHGKKIAVKSAHDSSDYDYAKGAPQARLGLSILRDIDLAPPPSSRDLVEIALAEVARIHKAVDRRL